MTGEMKDCEEMIKTLSPDEFEAYIRINRTIETRTSYGVREELLSPKHKKWTRLSWSNGIRDWYISHPESINQKEVDEKIGATIKLDANQIVVPYSYSTVKKFQGCLKQLPLYSYSFEAKARGDVDEFEATLGWAMKQYEKLKEEEWKLKHR